MTRCAFLATVLLLLASCGDDLAPKPTVPAWAKVAPEQIAEAERHGVPMAFENDLGMRFVLIPAGTFLMGSPENEEGHERYENLHEVTISMPFYLQTTEATNEQFRSFRPDHRSGGYGKWTLDRDAQPVIDVSWEDATAFAAWLSRRDALRDYRLPTEAEWERACRAGSRARFSFGDDEDDLSRFANASEGADLRTASPADLADGCVATAPVGSYGPNAWGLHDMHGNVQEWCGDGWAHYPTGSTAMDPVGQLDPVAGRRRALRGGWWHSGPEGVRCAVRRTAAEDFCYISTGFRLVSPLPPPGERGR